MSSKIVLPIVLVILVLLAVVGIYASLSNLNPLKESKTISSLVSPKQTSPQDVNKLVVPAVLNPYTSESSRAIPIESPAKVIETKAPTQKTLPSKVKTFSVEDLAANKTESSCYVSISNKVYDVTAYIDQHPGGMREILRGCGQKLDGMKHAGGAFTSDKIQSILAEYIIGELK